jgi:hypothetical protein
MKLYDSTFLDLELIMRDFPRVGFSCFLYQGVEAIHLGIWLLLRIQDL